MKKKLLAGVILALLFSLLALAPALAAKMNNPWLYREGEAVDFETARSIAMSAGVDTNVWHALPNNMEFTSNYLWMSTKLTSGDSQERTLFFSTTEVALRVWFDGELIYEYGIMGGDRFANGGWMTHLVTIPEVKSEAELTFELYSDRPERLGHFDYISLDTGTDQAIKLFAYDASYILALPITLFMLVIMIYMYQEPMATWKKLYLRIIGFLLSFGLWVLSVSNARLYIFNSPTFWWYVMSTLAYVMPICANYIVYEILEAQRKKYVMYIIRIYAVFFLAALIGEVLGLHGLSRFMAVYYVLLAVAEIFVFCLTVGSMRDGNHYSRAILVPIVGFTFFGVLDGLGVQYHIFDWVTFYTPIGIYTFLIFILAIFQEQIKESQRLDAMTAELEYERTMAVEKSSIDQLTGCWNRNAFKPQLKAAVASADRNEEPLAMLMLDLDHFKNVNDTYGHAVGDEVLRNFAATVREHLGERLNFIRWGGEEFVVLCPGFNFKETLWFAEEIRAAVEEAAINPKGGTVTCSIGITLWRGEKDNTEKFFKRVDTALYMAKERGRNRVSYIP